MRKLYINIITQRFYKISCYVSLLFCNGNEKLVIYDIQKFLNTISMKLEPNACVQIPWIFAWHILMMTGKGESVLQGKKEERKRFFFVGSGHFSFLFPFLGQVGG